MVLFYTEATSFSYESCDSEFTSSRNDVVSSLRTIPPEHSIPPVPSDTLNYHNLKHEKLLSSRLPQLNLSKINDSGFVEGSIASSSKMDTPRPLLLLDSSHHRPTDECNAKEMQAQGDDFSWKGSLEKLRQLRMLEFTHHTEKSKQCKYIQLVSVVVIRQMELLPGC